MEYVGPRSGQGTLVTQKNRIGCMQGSERGNLETVWSGDEDVGFWEGEFRNYGQVMKM